MSLQPEQGDLLAPTLSRAQTRTQLRRLSSMTADRADLFSGPAVVAPPRHMRNPSNAHQTAMAMELAKHRLAEDSETSTPTDTTGITTPEEGEVMTTDKYAFAFDIDGVLIKGGAVIPEAIEAMKVLNGQNEFNIKVQVQPHCFAYGCG